MHLSFANKHSSLGFRLVASLAAALVFALTVFAASPELHAWLHSYDAPGTHHAHPEGHPAPDAGPDQDDDCAVVMFAQGVVAALLLVFFGIVAWRIAAFAPVHVERLVSRAPDFLLPPLCGPPVS